MPATANITLGPRARGVVLAVAGVATLLMVSVSALGTIRLVRHGLRAKGSVTALYAGSSHPKVEFVARDGATFVFPGNGFVSHRVGDAVTVVYHADNPGGSAVLDEPGALWMFDVATGTLGLGALAAGLFLLRRARPATLARRTVSPGSSS
jgi:hypothetical protein